jgi:hypothetical protein
VYYTYVPFSSILNVADEVAQFQEKSLGNFDFESEVVAGEGDRIFETGRLGQEKCFWVKGDRES